MITVAIVEDHRVLIDALAVLLRTDHEFHLVGSAGDLASACQMIQTKRPQVLLLDLCLPDGNGLDLVPFIRKYSSKTQILVLTSRTDEATLMRVVNQGITGYFYKGGALEDLLNTIRKVACGETVMPAHLLLGLVKRVSRDQAILQNDDYHWERLTPREREVLACLSKGQNGEAIADELSIAPLTVRTHIRNLMSKLGVHSRLEAVAFGLQNGLIDAPV